MTNPELAERQARSDQSKATQESLIDKMGREAYVFGVGTLGGALKEAGTDIVNHPGATAVKVAESIGVGAAFAAAEFAPLPIRIGARALGTGLMVHFFSDLADKDRWQGLGKVWGDTWNSSANIDQNFDKVQGSLGRLALESSIMVAGAKLGARGVGKVVEMKFGQPGNIPVEVLEGKNSSPLDAANLKAGGGFTDIIRHDVAAWDAARSAAIQRAGIFSRTTPLNEAAIGSEAYIAGQKGNAYTAFLRDRYGAWTTQNAQWSESLLRDVPSRASSSDLLFKSGLPLTHANLAAATNPNVIQLPAMQRKAAIRAVSDYASTLAGEQHPHGWVLNGTVGRIAPAMSKAEVRAATDVQLLNHGRMNTADVQSASRVHTATIGNEGYPAFRTARDVYARMKSVDSPELAAALAEKLVPEMIAAGFRHEQLIRPNIVQVAAEVYGKDPRQLPAAAISARILPNKTSVETVGGIQSMLDAGWNGNSITRTELQSALAIAKAGRQPSPAEVSRVRSQVPLVPPVAETTPSVLTVH
jgi:hypothetical protein